MTDSMRGTTPTPVTDNNGEDSHRFDALQRTGVTPSNGPKSGRLQVLQATTCAKCGQPILGELYLEKPNVWTGYRPHHRECCRHLTLNPWRDVTCWICRRVFWVADRRMTRRYCSEPCRAEANRRRCEKRRRTNSDRTCQLCEQPFTGRADARYCSTRCRVAAHRAKSPPPLARTSATSATPQQGRTP